MAAAAAAALTAVVVVLEDEDLGLGIEGEVLAPGKGSCFHFVGLVGKRLMSFAGGVEERSKLSSSFLFLGGGAFPAEIGGGGGGGGAEEACPSIICKLLETDEYLECSMEYVQLVDFTKETKYGSRMRLICE